LSLFHDDSRGSSTGFAGSVIGRGGEVFMLNMGQPVKLLTWQGSNSLGWMKWAKDIDILFTGLRPGENCSKNYSGEHMNQPSTKKLLLSATPANYSRKS